MSSKFTPGPWVAQRAEDAYCIASVGNLVIMPESGRVKHDNTAADARLIAAAPELLEALAWMIEKTEAGEFHDGKCLMAARAAIAKAKGE